MPNAGVNLLIWHRGKTIFPVFSTSVRQIAYFFTTFGTVMDIDCQFGLARAIYIPDELNRTIYGLMKRKTSYWPLTYAKRTSQGTSQGTR